MSLRDIYENGFDEDDGTTSTEAGCPECDGSLETEAGEIACVDCGLIVNDYRFDHGPERPWDDKNERTGAPITPSRHDRGLSTEIGYGRDANGNTLSGGKRRQLGRLRREHTRARWGSKVGRNLSEGLAEIARMTDGLDLPRAVRDRASTIFRRAQAENLLLGRSIEAVATASVYTACRCDGFLRTLDEVVELARCEHSGVLNAYRVLNVEFGLEAKPRRPVEFIPRFASECDVPDRVQHRARELALLSEERGLGNGRKPSGVAAACLYLAARKLSWPLTQAEVATVANTSEVTIRARYQELVEEVDGATSVTPER